MIPTRDSQHGLGRRLPEGWRRGKSGLGGIAPRRPSFTLAELLIVMSIMAIMASAVLFALYGVMEDAREARTRAQVAKIHELLMVKWESYRTRPMPAKNVNDADPLAVARTRLLILRELMRMELPDRKTDLEDGPRYQPQPALWRAYRRKVDKMLAAQALKDGRSSWSWNDWSEQTYQGAECLYLILSMMQDGDTNALGFFAENEIGDVDGDGMFEILDGWGRPIEFLRWAPGFTHLPGRDGAWGHALEDDDGNKAIDDYRERGYPGVTGATSPLDIPSDDEPISDIQRYEPLTSPVPDPFDPLKVDYRFWNSAFDEYDRPFALYPLVYSAGRDKGYDLFVDDANVPIRYTNTTLNIVSGNSSVNILWANDPYYVHTIGTPPNQVQYLLGMPIDAAGDGQLNCIDNITNHQLGLSR